MVIGVRVESENIQTGNKKHCNSSYFTMVAKDDTGKNVPVPGLILRTKQDVRRYTRSIARQEHAKNRSNAFDASEFKVEQHLKSLEQHNATLEL